MPLTSLRPWWRILDNTLIDPEPLATIRGRRAHIRRDHVGRHSCAKSSDDGLRNIQELAD